MSLLRDRENYLILGQPKGIIRPIGGHLATLCWSMKTIYGMTKNSVWWVASDMGWVVGHSYICYGPLVYGATSVMYEGKPDRTPDASQYFRFEHFFLLKVKRGKFLLSKIKFFITRSAFVVI